MGWVNLDIESLPGVDVVLDAARELPFHDVEAVYAEHFLEHLRIDAALAFLVRAQRALRPGAWLRLSTPNLDWVVRMQYDRKASGEEKAIRGLQLNRAFHGWGHQFLWNREALELVLAATGFEGLRFCRYGESALEIFSGIERHETYQDAPGEPHVLIVEARKGEVPSELLQRVRDFVRDEYLAHLEPMPRAMIDVEEME
ncbi:MAG: hypothetical protein K8H90_04175 [Thermoanaerobaculia bacterium]|nr:hypothetical protein [Thermoanaerobaculia bacterium]